MAFVPTPDGREALRTAAVFARRVNAQLHVVTVVAEEAEVMSYRIGQDAEQRYVSAAQEEFQRAIEDAIAELAPDLTASGRCSSAETSSRPLPTCEIPHSMRCSWAHGATGRSPCTARPSAGLMRQLEHTCCCRAALWLESSGFALPHIEERLPDAWAALWWRQSGDSGTSPSTGHRQSSSHGRSFSREGSWSRWLRLGPDDVDMLVYDGSRGYGQVRRVLLGGLLAADPRRPAAVTVLPRAATASAE